MPPIDRQALADRAAALRLTPAELAAKAGCSHPMVLNMLSGYRQPGVQLLHRLSAALGCTYGDLLSPDAAASARTLLAAVRIRAGVSGTDLAARAGVSKAHLRNLEAGRRNPSPALLQRLAAALGCQPAAIDDRQAAA